jgi:CRP-like cAMP-binding protein
VEKDYRTATFSKSPVFGHFDVGTLGELADSCELIEYKAGDLVFAEGDMPSAISIIDEGTVELVKRVNDSIGLVLYHLGPGAIVEINPFMDGQPHYLSALARTRIRLMKVPLNAFLKAVGADPRIEHRVLLEILRIQTVGLRTLNKRFSEFLSRAAG